MNCFDAATGSNLIYWKDKIQRNLKVAGATGSSSPNPLTIYGINQLMLVGYLSKTYGQILDMNHLLL